MSALAKYLLKFGKKVGGSDAVSSEFTDELIEKCVKIDFEIGRASCRERV